MIDWRVALRLGRVSNLPTVWTNLLAGLAIAGAVTPLALALLLPAASLFYVAGMFLNDACDRGIDAVERPERPIPSGQVTAAWVFAAAALMMVAGLALVMPLGGGPLIAAIGLAVAILAYDLHHKGNPYSPLVMGACRALVYGVAALSVAAPQWPWAIPALGLLAYVAGLTYAARQENMAEFRNAWPLVLLAVPVVIVLLRANLVAVPFLLIFLAWLAHGLRLLLLPSARDIRRAVGALIAGISLFDATLIATYGRPGLAIVALIGFVATLGLHRKVAGT